ncbi:FKBP-type peptidyl-prolyl cis-trans isomerase [Alloprevotella tannerae]
MANNKTITLTYRLTATDREGKAQPVEEATAERPFRFITGLNFALDTFETKVIDLKTDEAFDFTLTQEEAYGPYEEENLRKLPKDMFTVDGHFDKENIFAGNIVPFENDNGERFNGTILNVTDDTVIVDLNHPLAGCSLHFTGKVVETRETTKEELAGFLSMLSGEGGCGCGCGEEGCGDHCGDHCSDHCDHH